MLPVMEAQHSDNGLILFQFFSLGYDFNTESIRMKYTWKVIVYQNIRAVSIAVKFHKFFTKQTSNGVFC